MKFVIQQTACLYHRGYQSTTDVHSGKWPLIFYSRKEAKAWIDANPFTGDKYGVIRHITYKVRQARDVPYYLLTNPDSPYHE
jgi:hypothetical protein